MNYSIIRYIVGSILQFEGAFLLPSTLVGLIYGETFEALVFFGSAVLCFLLGTVLKKIRPGNRNLFSREGLTSVALSWFVMPAFGAIPLRLTGEIPHYVDALFETVSGFTTTGASILNNVEILSHASLFWRSFTHWIGGMGIIVFIMSFLPFMGGSSMNLMKAESPGPSVSRLVPRAMDTAKILYTLYIGLTVMCFITLLICGMPAFDAITTTFGTLGTGGFGIKNDSITSYSPAIQNAVTVFMILSGVNYTSYFFIIRKQFKDAFSLEEVKWYFAIVLCIVGAICINLRGMYGSIGETLRIVFFQVASLITTTGFSTADFDLWPEFSKMLLLLAMFIGACAGSTGGGIKVSRVMILLKGIKKELQMAIHPRLIKKIRMDGKPIPHDAIRSTNVFMSIYCVVLFFSVIAISVDQFDFTTNFTAVVATLNNIGPGLSKVGPTMNYFNYSIFSKIVLMFDMLAGRLELIPLMVLLVPSNWKKY